VGVEVVPGAEEVEVELTRVEEEDGLAVPGRH